MSISNGLTSSVASFVIFVQFFLHHPIKSNVIMITIVIMIMIMRDEMNWQN